MKIVFLKILIMCGKTCNSLFFINILIGDFALLKYVHIGYIVLINKNDNIYICNY